MTRTLQMLGERQGGDGQSYSVVVTLNMRTDVAVTKRELAKGVGALLRKRLGRTSVGVGGGVAQVSSTEVKRVVDPGTTLGWFGM